MEPSHAFELFTILGQATTGPSVAHDLFTFLGTIPWFGYVAIVAIISGAISSTVYNGRIHRERMAMIQAGMHPDEASSKGIPTREV